ncbi:MAG: cysteine hydrolase [Clostridia bacterium]|nr:cysteine hydrolase [Clostridia bacterium]
MDGTWGAEIHEAVAPQPGDVVIGKSRISAFAGTDLQGILQIRGIDTLVLMGVVTNFVVEGTARDAVDRGYRVVIPEDACVGITPAAHRFTVEHVLPMLARVVTVDEVVQRLQARGG